MNIFKAVDGDQAYNSMGTIPWELGCCLVSHLFKNSTIPICEYFDCTVNLPEVNGVTLGSQVTRVLYRA